MQEQTEFEATHTVTLTLKSNGADDAVAISVDFSPDFTREDYEREGYFPAAYDFANRFVFPLLEEIHMRSEHPEMFNVEPPSNTRN